MNKASDFEFVSLKSYLKRVIHRVTTLATGEASESCRYFKPLTIFVSTT
jgi:hypothetical protein